MGLAVFKTVEGATSSLAGSIPVRLRSALPRSPGGCVRTVDGLRFGTMPTAEQEWQELLSGAHADRSLKSPLRFIPSNPRCKLCRAPFRAPGNVLLRPFGFKPWAKNPHICGRCFAEMDKHAKRCPSPLNGEAAAGAEVEA